MNNYSIKSKRSQIEEDDSIEATRTVGSSTDQPGSMTVSLGKGDTVTRRDGTKITVNELRSLIRQIIRESAR